MLNPCALGTAVGWFLVGAFSPFCAAMRPRGRKPQWNRQLRLESTLATGFWVTRGRSEFHFSIAECSTGVPIRHSLLVGKVENAEGLPASGLMDEASAETSLVVPGPTTYGHVQEEEDEEEEEDEDFCKSSSFMSVCSFTSMRDAFQARFCIKLGEYMSLRGHHCSRSCGYKAQGNFQLQPMLVWQQLSGCPAKDKHLGICGRLFLWLASVEYLERRKARVKCYL